MTRLYASFLALALSLPTLAVAQWQWTDSTGRRVFSDQAPPPDVPASRILKQPGVKAAPPAPVAENAASPAAPTATAAKPPPAGAAKPTIAGRDKDLEEKRKQAEAAEAQKRKDEEERVAKARAENCTRARQAKATLDSGIRLARVNDKGEREIMDDKNRAAEAKRLDEVITSDCKAS